ncbi:MAG: ABC transporter ATP-binding protein [Hyphomicrobium sp.]|nr:ABC transporter ATP-binding protein [Hyphomicrobium sp.]
MPLTTRCRVSLKSWLSTTQKPLPGPIAVSNAVAGAPRSRAAATFAARLTIENLTRTYGEATALNGVSLDVSPGEIVCLLGPSGCGKTTLLRVVSGIERPSTGRVLINDREVAGPTRYVPPEDRSIGLMFQDFALFPHLNILDNVAFGLRSLAPDVRERSARAILDRVGLADFAEAYPSTLSGGQQQRVALARAIVPRPAVMLMDEPFSGLDIQLRDTMQEETLALLRETRATSLIVTHNPEEAMRLGDRIVVLKSGRIVQQGSTETLYRNPASLFVARLFSEINEIPVRVQDGRVVTAAGTFAAPGLSDGTAAVLCLRERAIEITPAGANGCDKLNGRVTDIKFLGDMTRIDLAVEGFDQILKARVGGADGLRKGSEVKVSIQPGAGLVFPFES